MNVPIVNKDGFQLYVFFDVLTKKYVKLDSTGPGSTRTDDIKEAKLYMDSSYMKKVLDQAYYTGYEYWDIIPASKNS